MRILNDCWRKRRLSRKPEVISIYTIKMWRTVVVCCPRSLHARARDRPLALIFRKSEILRKNIRNHRTGRYRLAVLKISSIEIQHGNSVLKKPSKATAEQSLNSAQDSCVRNRPKSTVTGRRVVIFLSIAFNEFSTNAFHIYTKIIVSSSAPISFTYFINYISAL